MVSSITILFIILIHFLRHLLYLEDHHASWICPKRGASASSNNKAMTRKKLADKKTQRPGYALNGASASSNNKAMTKKKLADKKAQQPTIKDAPNHFGGLPIYVLIKCS
jgi:hypothetical protein